MSTSVSSTVVRVRRAPSRPTYRNRLLRLAAQHPLAASVALAAAYLASLAAVTAALAYDALGTPLGISAMVAFAVTLAITFGVGIWTVLPENR